jgi:hypothetical protein
MDMHVNSPELNLRTEPVVKPSTLIVSLPFGQKVKVLSDSHREGWKIVSTRYKGTDHQGHISGAFLRPPLSEPVEGALQAAAGEWDRFNRGGGKETRDPFFRFVGEMWRARGENFDGRDTEQFWSAACISFILEKAGYRRFKFATQHSVYIHEAVAAREAGTNGKDYWGFRLGEHKPKIGDLIARRRTSSTHITYDLAKTSGSFPSHTDLVVAVGDGHVDAIGGNVSNSVSVTRYKTDPQGFVLPQNGRNFAILRNNHN